MKNKIEKDEKDYNLRKFSCVRGLSHRHHGNDGWWRLPGQKYGVDPHDPEGEKKVLEFISEEFPKLLDIEYIRENHPQWIPNHLLAAQNLPSPNQDD